jgi:hypothetical protein
LSVANGRAQKRTKTTIYLASICQVIALTKVIQSHSLLIVFFQHCAALPSLKTLLIREAFVSASRIVCGGSDLRDFYGAEMSGVQQR